MMDLQYQQYYAGQAPQRTLAPQPYMGPVYAAGGSQATRPGPIMHGAAVGLDLNHDGLEPFPPPQHFDPFPPPQHFEHFSMQPPYYGRPDLIVQGPDYNQDGIPDALQQAPEDEEPLRVTMVVPEGALPGTKLQYVAPDGQELRLTVPEGVPAGSMMTLTQDPVTRQWKCMAEPAEVPGPYEPVAPPPAQMYGSSVNTYTAPAATYAAPQERVTYVGGIAPVVTTYTAPPASYLPRTVQPVNLSYVPPPVVMQQPAVTSMGQVIAAAPGSLAADPSRFNPPRQMPEYHYGGEQHYVDQRQMPEYQYCGEQYYVDQRPSYTPPPVILDQRPSYQPPPAVLAGAQAMPRIGDAALLGSTAKVHMAPPIVIGQTPSYVPPPVQVMQNNPSYVPPMQPGMMQTAMGYDGQAASIQMPAGMQGPSITTLPPQGQPMMGQQMPMRMMGQPGMPPMMTGMPGVGGQMPGFMPSMGGLPPFGQMPPLGQLPPMGAPSMGMLGPGSAPPLGSGLVPPGATPGIAGMPGGIQDPQMMQQMQLQQQQQQMQQQQMGMGMQGAYPGQMPGQLQHYQMPGMAPPYPGGMPGMEATTMYGGMQPHQAMTMPGMMQPQQAPGGMPQAY